MLSLSEVNCQLCHERPIIALMYVHCKWSVVCLFSIHEILLQETELYKHASSCAARIYWMFILSGPWSVCLCTFVSLMSVWLTTCVNSHCLVIVRSCANAVKRNPQKDLRRWSTPWGQLNSMYWTNNAPCLFSRKLFWILIIVYILFYAS